MSIARTKIAKLGIGADESCETRVGLPTLKRENMGHKYGGCGRKPAGGVNFFVSRCF
jgi:hypothetical protein